MRGPNVFQGYWRNEAATRAAFDGDWYRTGDLGYIEDGYIYLKGRKKDLIVLADGQNVYPEDVEEALRRQPGVHDAVVFGLPRGGDVEVHAVVAESEPGSAAVAVRLANEKLDDRQQVRGFTTWPGEDFPRTLTLKVKRPLVAEWLGQQTRETPATAAGGHRHGPAAARDRGDRATRGRSHPPRSSAAISDSTRSAGWSCSRLSRRRSACSSTIPR